MQYSISDVLLLTSISMIVLFLVLAALAVMVKWLISVMPEGSAPTSAETAADQTPLAAPDDKDLNQLAAVVGIALARARTLRERSREGGQTRRGGFTPWRNLARSNTAGHLDRGWRPR